MSSHVTPLRTYYVIFGALLVLTAVTVGVAFVDLGAFNTPLALAIAGTKAMLVILWFMHVKAQSKLTWLFVASGFLWFLVLVGLTLADYFTRVETPGWI